MAVWSHFPDRKLGTLEVLRRSQEGSRNRPALLALLTTPMYLYSQKALEGQVDNAIPRKMPPQESRGKSQSKDPGVAKRTQASLPTGWAFNSQCDLYTGFRSVTSQVSRREGRHRGAKCCWPRVTTGPGYKNRCFGSSNPGLLCKHSTGCSGCQVPPSWQLERCKGSDKPLPASPEGCK